MVLGEGFGWREPLGAGRHLEPGSSAHPGPLRRGDGVCWERGRWPQAFPLLLSGFRAAGCEFQGSQTVRVDKGSTVR